MNMKRINIFAALLMLALSVSCSRKETFVNTSFLSLYGDKISVQENEGVLSVPVTLYNPGGSEVQVTVTVTSGKAVEGTDYEIISPALGVMTFTGQPTSEAAVLPPYETQNIEIDITEFKGVLTGSKDFTIEIASATAGVDVGDIRRTVVTIKDNDHPLDKLFLGDWRGVALYADQAGTPFPMNISIIPDDEDPTFKGVFIHNLDPYLAQNGIVPEVGMNIFKGKANNDNTEIVVKANQLVGEVGTYGPAYIYGGSGEGFDSNANKDIIIRRNEDGTLTIVNGFGSLISQGWLSYYYGNITLTKAK